MSICDKEHRNWAFLETLPLDQGGEGRHKCAGCAYEQGFAAGLRRDNTVKIDLESLPVSQAGAGRHRSPHAAFTEGLNDGVKASYSV